MTHVRSFGRQLMQPTGNYIESVVISTRAQQCLKVGVQEKADLQGQYTRKFGGESGDPFFPQKKMNLGLTETPMQFALS